MIVIKIGGGDSIDLVKIADDLVNLQEEFIIVHGGNALRDQLLEKLSIEKEIITSTSGYTSVKSTDELIDVMLMSYAGLRNKRVVELLQQRGINALGLTGADGKVIQGKRNKGIRARQGDKRVIVRDNSGKPYQINTALLTLLLSNGYTPILTVPLLDKQGNLINSENDDIVATLCNAMDVSKVVMLIEEPGLLEDRYDPTSKIERLNHVDLEQWENKTEGRMKRKLHAISKMISADGPTVTIADGRVQFPIMNAIRGEGTVIEW